MSWPGWSDWLQQIRHHAILFVEASWWGHPPTRTIDPAGQLTNLKNGCSETTTLAYGAAGRKTETRPSYGTKTSLTYDAANQTTGIVNLNSSNTTLSYFN